MSNTYTHGREAAADDIKAVWDAYEKRFEGTDDIVATAYIRGLAMAHWVAEHSGRVEQALPRESTSCALPTERRT